MQNPRRRARYRSYWQALLVATLLLPWLPAWGSAANAWLIPVEGAIGPATADYIDRRLDAAAQARVPIVILQIDTPGGLDAATRRIVSAILDSPVPVACLVAPAGARAASAGTFILYACHIAAMAPTTHLGAATPVAIGGPGAPGGDEQPRRQRDEAAEDDDQSERTADGSTAMERKTLNDAIAYIRGLAERRGRNADWAEAAVRGAATLTAREALEKNVIDVMARDAASLLDAIDGRTVEMADGELTLATAELGIETLQPDWRHRFLAAITDPNVAYILMLIGIYGLILEFYNPGALVPGVVGGISLLVALYAFQIMPISYVGLALILLGIALMIAEAFMPSFGMLGIGGVVAFVVGSIMLMDSDVPGYEIALPLIVSVGVASAFLMFAVVGVALRARRQAQVSGQSTLIGQVAEAAEDFEQHRGRVRLHGEWWNARSATPVTRGQAVRVNDVEGLTLLVVPISSEEE